MSKPELEVIHRHLHLQVHTAHGAPRLPVSLHWDPTASLEVGLSIRRHDGALQADWVFARQLLADALQHGSAGVGDVHVRSLGVDPDVVEIVIRVEGHAAAVRFDRVVLAGFVNQTRGLVGLDAEVPFQCEHCPLNDPSVFPAVIRGLDEAGQPAWLARALCPDCLAPHTQEATQ